MDICLRSLSHGSYIGIPQDDSGNLTYGNGQARPGDVFEVCNAAGVPSNSPLVSGGAPISLKASNNRFVTRVGPDRVLRASASAVTPMALFTVVREDTSNVTISHGDTISLHSPPSASARGGVRWVGAKDNLVRDTTTTRGDDERLGFYLIPRFHSFQIVPPISRRGLDEPFTISTTLDLDQESLPGGTRLNLKLTGGMFGPTQNWWVIPGGSSNRTRRFNMRGPHTPALRGRATIQIVNDLDPQDFDTHSYRCLSTWDGINIRWSINSVVRENGVAEVRVPTGSNSVEGTFQWPSGLVPVSGNVAALLRIDHFMCDSATGLAVQLPGARLEAQPTNNDGVPLPFERELTLDAGKTISFKYSVVHRPVNSVIPLLVSITRRTARSRLMVGGREAVLLIART